MLKPYKSLLHKKIQSTCYAVIATFILVSLTFLNVAKGIIQLPPGISPEEIISKVGGHFPYYDDVNGCGPNDFSNWVVPNGFLLYSDFTNYCHHHDQCYMTLGADRNKCDTDLRRDISNQCRSDYGIINPLRPLCLGVAELYLVGVENGGSSAFTTAQRKQREYEDKVQIEVAKIINLRNNNSDPKCVSFQEPGATENAAWADNSLCSNASDVALQWSTAQPISGMYCVNVQEPGDPNNWAWTDNYICSSKDIGLQWSYTGLITGKHCINVHEPGTSYNAAWLDNYLCSDVPVLEYYLGPNCIFVHEPGSPTDPVWQDNLLCTVRNQGLVWSFTGPIVGMYCVNVQEPGDPNNWAWTDNYICSPRDIELQWSVGGPVPGKYCVNVQEPKDPNNPAWFDNYLCSSENVGFSWIVQ